jgi:outer membrane biosynthesis protein TonB
VGGGAHPALDVLLARTRQIDRHSGCPLRFNRVTALPSRSGLCLAAALAVCAAARAEDKVAAAPPEAAANPAPPPGGGDGGAKPQAASVAVEEDSAGDDEASPPAPAGDERRQIGDYIRNHTREIRDCYEKRLQERKTLQGKLVARFDIGPSGHVIGATAEGMGDRELSLCVVKVVRGWEFEKPQSGGKLRVGYPWVFTPAPAQ